MYRLGIAVLSIVLAVICVCCSFASAAPTDVIGATYVADVPFPQFMYLWQEGWGLQGPDGEPLRYAREGMPLGGYVHIYFRNPSTRPLEIADVLLDGVSLVKGIGFSQDIKEGYHPASIHFSKLPKAQISRLVAAGEPVWWKVDPQPIAPNAMGELVLRLRRNPKSPTLEVKLLGGGLTIPATVKVRQAHPRAAGIYFSPKLDSIYLYLTHPARSGLAPTKVFLDDRDVTRFCSIAADKGVGVVPVAIRLPAPLAMCSFHCFRAVYPDGSTALAGIRAWGSDLAYGMWGSKGNARETFVDFARHNINVQMTHANKEVTEYSLTPEGFEFLQSLGIRQMPTSPGNARNPIFYFLQDEPDAHDFDARELEPLDRLGALGMGMIEKSQRMRKADPITPQLLNIDGTYKPENWYMYAQLPDILCSDPYYQAELQRVYYVEPGSLWAHTKPTYVYAVGSISQWAGAPRPVHLILNSVKHLAKNAPFRYATPEEKRVEVYYALGAGVKGISYWWYTPRNEYDGCGSDEPDAVALWREIGLLGAELRTAGPVLTTSCPAALPVTASSRLWVRSLLAGLDTVALVVVNDNIASDREGTVVKPLQKAQAKVTLPSWLRPSDVFEITSAGVQDLAWKRDGKQISLDLGTVNLTRLILLSADAELRSRLQDIYQTQLAANTQDLINASGP